MWGFATANPGYTFFIVWVLAWAWVTQERPPAMWQPIDTAPRNEQVLVFEPDAEPHVVAAVLVDNHFGRWWQYADQCIQDAAPDGPIATHWMPLPAPPAKKE